MNNTIKIFLLFSVSVAFAAYQTPDAEEVRRKRLQVLDAPQAALDAGLRPNAMPAPVRARGTRMRSDAEALAMVNQMTQNSECGRLPAYERPQANCCPFEYDERAYGACSDAEAAARAENQRLYALQMDEATTEMFRTGIDNPEVIAYQRRIEQRVAQSERIYHPQVVQHPRMREINNLMNYAKCHGIYNQKSKANFDVYYHQAVLANTRGNRASIRSAFEELWRLAFDEDAYSSDQATASPPQVNAAGQAYAALKTHNYPDVVDNSDTYVARELTEKMRQVKDLKSRAELANLTAQDKEKIEKLYAASVINCDRSELAMLTKLYHRMLLIVKSAESNHPKPYEALNPACGAADEKELTKKSDNKPKARGAQAVMQDPAQPEAVAHSALSLKVNIDHVMVSLPSTKTYDAIRNLCQMFKERFAQKEYGELPRLHNLICTQLATVGFDGMIPRLAELPTTDDSQVEEATIANIKTLLDQAEALGIDSSKIDSSKIKKVLDDTLCTFAGNKIEMQKRLAKAKQLLHSSQPQPIASQKTAGDCAAATASRTPDFAVVELPTLENIRNLLGDAMAIGADFVKLKNMFDRVMKVHYTNEREMRALYADAQKLVGIQPQPVASQQAAATTASRRFNCAAAVKNPANAQANAPDHSASASNLPSQAVLASMADVRQFSENKMCKQRPTFEDINGLVAYAQATGQDTPMVQKLYECACQEHQSGTSSVLAMRYQTILKQLEPKPVGSTTPV
ncbi:MAG: hypothetical protein OXC30_01000 [Alphaproteobacteria bacterium]|nr:hypothetical protein [Alphaproteobacteria bacterium]